MISIPFSNDGRIRYRKTVNDKLKRNRDGLGLSRKLRERFKGVAGRRTLTKIRPRFAFGPPQRPLVARHKKPVENLVSRALTSIVAER